jgi:hypothetical protein
MIFDYYEIRARQIPAAVAASPLILPMLSIGFRVDGGWMWTSVAATTILILGYAFSLLVRSLGKRIEPGLWASWGGPPSTLILGTDEATFPSSTKERIYQAVLQETQIDIDPTHSSEGEWKERVWEAFRLVRQFIRQRQPKGLWLTHDAEYGALRNLLGSARLTAGVAAFSTVVCAFTCWREFTILAAALTIVGAAMFVLALLSRPYVLPTLVREAAFRYAESAWLAYLATASPAATAAAEATAR